MASAQTTTLDVTAQSPYAGFDPASQSLGDHANLAVTSTTRSGGFGASPVLCPSVSLWNAGYGSLPGAAFACQNGGYAEFFFQPAAGHQVFLSSLQMGSWLNGQPRAYTLNVYDSSWGTPLYTSSGTLGSLLTLNPNVSSNTGLYVQWGPDWDTGVNYITTTVSLQVVATPEPASVVLLSSGLLGIAGFARRRRSTT